MREASIETRMFQKGRVGMTLGLSVYNALPVSAKNTVTKLWYGTISRIPAERWVRWEWRRKFRAPLNLERPQTYNERLQWLKVYGEHRSDVFGDVNLARICADKFAVRQYVSEAIGEDHLVPLLGVYPRLEEVPFDDLPDSFVLKATHDSGSVVVVSDKRDLKGRLRQRLSKLDMRLGVNYGKRTKEWVYDCVSPRVIVEEVLSTDHHIELWDYKVFVFRGEPRLVQVDIDRFGNHQRCYYTPTWLKTDLAVQYPLFRGDVPRPLCLATMLEYSSLLARPFLHARVDWYVLGDKLVFGEITFFHESGFGRFSDYAWELELGRWMAW